ncbi:hypothetical protein FISHEDRAFT_56951 [Fistulina hepatica ATCC 64428]|nr:hypothetical protein FISHEDRAFT_56951 [Fistulina hepatica ATCC 64428]
MPSTSPKSLVAQANPISRLTDALLHRSSMKVERKPTPSPRAFAWWFRRPSNKKDTYYEKAIVIDEPVEPSGEDATNSGLCSDSDSANTEAFFSANEAEELDFIPFPISPEASPECPASPDLNSLESMTAELTLQSPQGRLPLSSFRGSMGSMPPPPPTSPFARGIYEHDNDEMLGYPDSPIPVEICEVPLRHPRPRYSEVYPERGMENVLKHLEHVVRLPSPLPSSQLLLVPTTASPRLEQRLHELHLCSPSPALLVPISPVPTVDVVPPTPAQSPARDVSAPTDLHGQVESDDSGYDASESSEGSGSSADDSEPEIEDNRRVVRRRKNGVFVNSWPASKFHEFHQLKRRRSSEPEESTESESEGDGNGGCASLAAAYNRIADADEQRRARAAERRAKRRRLAVIPIENITAPFNRLAVRKEGYHGRPIGYKEVKTILDLDDMCLGSQVLQTETAPGDDASMELVYPDEPIPFLVMDTDSSTEASNASDHPIRKLPRRRIFSPAPFTAVRAAVSSVALDLSPMDLVRRTAKAWEGKLEAPRPREKRQRDDDEDDDDDRPLASLPQKKTKIF